MKQLIVCLLLLCSTASAKDIKLIVPYSPGGPVDRISRILANTLNNKDYTFIVDYKLGGGGTVATKSLIATKNETAFMVISNGVTIAPLINPGVDYDSVKDVNLVHYIGSEALVLVVKNDGFINTFKEFQMAAKAYRMPYGSSGVGSSGHLFGAVVAGTNPNFIHVPYKGAAAATVDLLGNNIKWLIDSDTEQSELIAGGKTRPIAVYANTRLKKYPDVPTVKELGINDYGVYRYYILLSNTAADPRILAYVKSRLADPAIEQQIKDLGIDTAQPVARNFLQSDRNSVRAVLKHVNLQ